MIEKADIPEVEFSLEDGVFIKQMFMELEGTFVPQHSHSYSHSSFIATGSVRVWKDDIFMGDFVAPIPITIKEHVKHTFMSLEPKTTVYCIHRVDRSGHVDIHEHIEKVNENLIEEGVICLGRRQRQ